MKKILLALVISVFTVGAMACAGNNHSANTNSSDNTTKEKTKK